MQLGGAVAGIIKVKGKQEVGQKAGGGELEDGWCRGGAGAFAVSEKARGWHVNTAGRACPHKRYPPSGQL